MSAEQETYQVTEEKDSLVEELKKVRDRKNIIRDSLYTKKPGLALYVCNVYIPHVKYNVEKVGELFQCSATVQFGNEKLTFVAKNTRIKLAKNDASRFVVARFFPTYLNKSFPDFCDYINSEIINRDNDEKSSFPSLVSEGIEVQKELKSLTNSAQNSDESRKNSNLEGAISKESNSNENFPAYSQKKLNINPNKINIENNFHGSLEFGSNSSSCSAPHATVPAARQQIGSNDFRNNMNYDKYLEANYKYWSNIPFFAPSLSPGFGPMNNVNNLRRPLKYEYSPTMGPPMSKHSRLYASEYDQYEIMNDFESPLGNSYESENKKFAAQFYKDMLRNRMKSLQKRVIPVKKGFLTLNNAIPQSYREKICKSSDISNENFDNDLVDSKDVGNIIYNLVQKKYCELRKLSQHPDIYYKCDVLSGIVLVRNGEYKQGEVIAIGTGNRMIDSKLVSEKGDVVHDSHAEIICMRAMKIYFHSQLAKLATDPSESIFEVPKNTRGKYFLKDGVAFHLYISSAPCGDGRIFSLNSEDKHPNRRSRGVLRVKLHAGAGTIPNTTYANKMLRIADVRKMKENFMTACCSDKLARANILGFQGAILNNIIDPIYFESLTVGMIFHEKHLNRAVNERSILPQEKLKEPFRSNSVTLYKATNEKTPYYTTNHAKYSVNWISGESGVELNFPLLGKTSTKQPSRLCKSNLFKLFADYCRKNSLEAFSNFQDKSYAHFKSLNTSYQEVKFNTYGYFAESGRGEWKLKPKEWDSFCLDGNEPS